MTVLSNVYAGTYSADGALTAWTNPENALADDTNYATRVGTDKNVWYGNLYSFDLSSLPDSGTVNTVTLEALWMNSAVDTAGPVMYLGAQIGGTVIGTSTTDTSGGTVFETITNTPTGLTLAQLKATGADGFWAIVRFRRTDNTAHTATLDYVRVSVDYTVTYQVTPAEGTQTQIGDAATVNAAYSIAPAEGTQAQTGDGATGSTNYSASPGEGNQAQSGDAAPVFAAYNTDPAEGNQAQLGDAAGVSFEGAGAGHTRWTTYWATSFDQDQEAYVSLGTIAGTFRLWGRMVNPTGYGTNLRGYFAEYTDGTLSAHRYNDTGSVDVNLGGWAGTIANGDKLWMRLEGAVVSVYVYQSGSWIRRIFVTDPSPALESGYIGMDATDSGMVVDDFGGGDLLASITPADGFQTQTGDTATVSASYAITPDDGFQSQSGDAVTVGAAYNITPAEGFQSQSGDAATVSFASIGEIVVTPADGFQTQTGDACTVSFTPIAMVSVTPAQGYQGQTGDAATVSFTPIEMFSVTPGEGNQSQSGDLCSVYAAYFIATAQGYQTQTGEECTVVVLGALTPHSPSYVITSQAAASISFARDVIRSNGNESVSTNGKVIVSIDAEDVTR